MVQASSEAGHFVDGASPRLPPGPRLPSLIQAGHLWRRPQQFFEDCERRFGDCFTVRIPLRPPMVLFSSPEAIKEIFTADPNELRAGVGNVILEPVLGRHSLLLLDGGRHLRERRLMLPSFHGERMHFYGEVMRAVADRVIDSWPIGAPFPIQTEMQRITLDVILRTVFGVDEGSQMTTLRDSVTRLLSVATNPVLLMPFMQWNLGPRSPWGKLTRMKREVHGILSAEIRARRLDGSTGREDVLSVLMSARDENGEPMSEEELRDEMITLLLAGHETTASALAWAVHRILEHPVVLERLHDELRNVRGDGPLRPDDIGKLEYLDATIKEVLRLNPIIPEVGRYVTKPTRIGGRDLPAHVIAAPSIYLTHRRPDLWPEPEQFMPDRFLAARPGPYEFFPFGGGTRRCLGMAFALYEMKIVLAEVLSRVALRPAPGYRARTVRRSITLAPSDGVPVICKRRA